MKKVAVVILNYNGEKFLKQFLPSVISHSPLAEIIVADNASKDQSIALLKTMFPSVRLIELTENHGYAQGYNEALAQVESEYYILLNSDVEVCDNWIEPIITLMDSDDSIAACQPKLLDFNKKDTFEYAGAAGGFIDFLGYPFCRGRIFNNLEIDHGQYDDTREVFWATGACMFVRATTFHEVGGFDGDFFAHMEEIDLCWRIHLAGYKVYYSAESTVYHVGGGTLHKSNPRKTYLNFRNGLALLYKNHPPQHLWLNILMRLVLDGIAGVKFMLDGGWQDCFAVIKAHFNFYANFGSWHKKRKALVRKNGYKFIYPNSIVKAHFLNGIKKFSDLAKSL
jgi:GT2 family glycosyltransferase